jgi:signal transduction histidine kinase
VTAGDINADGFDDVIVGGLMDKTDPDGGMVALYMGSRTGLLPFGYDPGSHPISARRIEPAPQVWWTQAWFWAVATLILVAIGLVSAWHIVTTTRLRRQLRHSEQERTLERERLRIARDLHDQLGSNLTTITLLSEVARRDLSAPDKAVNHLANIMGTARELTRALDEIVWAVNPRKDRLDQLASYFSAYAEEFLRPTDLRYRIDFPEELPDRIIPSEVRHHLFLVLKEALTNVVKHAAASEIRIRLKTAQAGLELTIEDDGRGFDQAAPDTGRNGLRNNRRRVEEIGGACDIASQVSEGTRIRVTVRLDGAASPA